MFDNKSLEEEPDGRIFHSRLRTSLDVKRTESLRGITVFRGQIPGSGSNKVTTTQQTWLLYNSFTPLLSGHAGVLSVEAVSVSVSPSNGLLIFVNFNTLSI